MADGIARLREYEQNPPGGQPMTELAHRLRSDSYAKAAGVMEGVATRLDQKAADKARLAKDQGAHWQLDEARYNKAFAEGLRFAVESLRGESPVDPSEWAARLLRGDAG